MPGQAPPVYISFQRTKGAGMTRVEGLRISMMQKEALLKTLKKRFGCGGTLKSGELELQGDRRDALSEELEGLGYRVKRKGG